MNKRSDISAAILAGGKSSRMGRDKALLDYKGKPFIQHIAEVVSGVFERVVIVSDRGDNYKFLEMPIHEDVFKNCGPLGGIHAALTSAPTQKVYVVSCDVPFVNQQVIHQLLLADCSADVVLFSDENRLQPLCGVYDARILPKLEEHLRRDQLSVTRFIQTVNTFYVSSRSSTTEILRALLNINSPEEYARHCRNIDVGAQACTTLE